MTDLVASANLPSHADDVKSPPALDECLAADSDESSEEGSSFSSESSPSSSMSGQLALHSPHIVGTPYGVTSPRFEYPFPPGQASSSEPHLPLSSSPTNLSQSLSPISASGDLYPDYGTVMSIGLSSSTLSVVDASHRGSYTIAVRGAASIALRKLGGGGVSIVEIREPPGLAQKRGSHSNLPPLIVSGSPPSETNIKESGPKEGANRQLQATRSASNQR